MQTRGTVGFSAKTGPHNDNQPQQEVNRRISTGTVLTPD